MIITMKLYNETNYTYFGARYYDIELSEWLSVDPNGASISEFNENDFLMLLNYLNLNLRQT
jgi:hypothetical protein